MWTFDNYDELAQWVFTTTQNFAEQQHHNPVDVPHLFYVLVNQSSNAIADLLKKWWADVAAIKSKTKEAQVWLLATQDKFSISEQLQQIFLQAKEVAKKMWDSSVSIYHIFLSLLQSKSSTRRILNQQGITFENMEAIISQMSKADLHPQDLSASLDPSAAEGQTLNKHSEDLTQLAKDGALKEVIWRDKEIKKVMEILCRKEKNNVVILGDAWVGKTAVAELLAQKIVTWDVPDYLKDKKILRVNLWSLVSWTKFRGEYEDKVSSIIKTVKESKGNIILFIDEFHNVVWAGKAEGSMSLSDMLKPELSSGTIQVIGATTTSEYRKNVEKDTGLTRRFETVTIAEPSVQETITILRGREWAFENYHGVTIYDTALIAAAEMSDRYITDCKLPDKALNVVDQAATKVKISMTSLPENISDLKIKIGQLTKESESIAQELFTTKDRLTEKELSEKLTTIKKQLEECNISYVAKKSDRETIKKLFEENKSLELQIQDLEKQAKAYELKSDLAKVSEIRYWKIAETQKRIAANKEQIGTLQAQSWIVIKDTVEREDIAQIISEKTGIPLTKMIEGESEKLAHLENYLSAKVIGQEEAIIAISNAIRRARTSLKDPKKPIWSFIFLGTTGVGKTELAKALAEFLFFDKKAMTRLNMSEYKEKSSVSKLIGADPWLVGYEQWGQLTEAVRRKPYSVVLLDEIEKAHPDVFDLFLQVFDDGMLNDSFGITVDFKNTIIIMTSNLWSREIREKLQWTAIDIGDIYPIDVPVVQEPIDEVQEEAGEEGKDEKTEADGQTKHKRHRSKKNKHKDWEKDTATSDSSQDEQASKVEELKEELDPILLDFFRPEFLNRLDETIIFNPMSPEMLKAILEIKIKEQSDLIYASNKIALEFSNQAKNYLAKKWRDPENGARPINRALQKYIIDPLSKKIVAAEITQWASIIVDIEDNKIVFKAE